MGCKSGLDNNAAYAAILRCAKARPRHVWPCTSLHWISGSARRLLRGVFFVFKDRQGIQGNAAAALARQRRQSADQFEPDLVMALCARRERLPLHQGDLMWEPVLCMKDFVESTLGNGVSALEEYGHFLRTKPQVNDERLIHSHLGSMQKPG